MSRELQSSGSTISEEERLRRSFADARYELLQVEEMLATEQAAVNAFRMHCRLKIGVLVEQATELRTERQRLLTRLQLLRQAEEFGIPYDEEDPFWHGEAFEFEEPEEPVILPTDTPRDKAAEKRLYRQLARRFHPDLAASAGEAAYRTAIMASINSAYQSGDGEALRDFAGELDPTSFLELGPHESREVRQLRRRIMACRKRKRRVLMELRALRKENTARLWRRAQELEAEGASWWEEVREELANEIERSRGEITKWQAEIDSLEGEPAGES